MFPVLLVLVACCVGVGGVTAHLHAATRRREALLPLLFLDIVFLGLVAVAAFAPRTFEVWMQEDGWVEWATFFAFAMAGGLFTRALVRAARGGTEPSPAWLSRLALAGLALFCFFVAGEEISWAQRIFAFKPPEVFLEANYQQELNVHNLLKEKELAGMSLDSRYLVALIALLYGLLAPAAALGLRRLGRPQPWLEAAAPPPILAPWLAAVALVELTYPISFAGEACELGLGLCFLVDASFRAPAAGRGRTTASAPVRATLLAAPLLLGLLAAPALDRLLYGDDEEAAAQAHAELELLADDLRDGAALDRLRRRKGVHKRVYTAVLDGYLAFGRSSRFLESRPTPADPEAKDPRRDRRGYFLDPWNNPYWIKSHRKSGLVVLYSFGPNRRRDTRFDLKRGMTRASGGGDDVIVVLGLDETIAQNR